MDKKFQSGFSHVLVLSRFMNYTFSFKLYQIFKYDLCLSEYNVQIVSQLHFDLNVC